MHRNDNIRARKNNIKNKNNNYKVNRKVRIQNLHQTYFPKNQNISSMISQKILFWINNLKKQTSPVFFSRAKLGATNY
jgi:hypothetical protein